LKPGFSLLVNLTKGKGNFFGKLYMMMMMMEEDDDDP
jgi:hypothetical protein